MTILSLTILVLFSLVGFAAIFFTTFGTLIILSGSVIYAFMTGFSILGLKALIVLLILYFIGEGLEYILIIAGVKKLGASNAAIIGALFGGIAGAIVGVGFFGVGIIVGTLLGIFLGAFLVELLIKKDFVKSLKAGTGGVLGRLGATFAKIIIAISMFALMANVIAKNL